MVFDGNLDTGQVKAIYQLLRDKVPVVRAGTVEGDSVKAGKVAFPEGRTIVEDDNSPFSASGSQSHTFTLASTYDLVIIQIKKIQNTYGGSATQDVQLRFNGLTNSSYNYQSSDGTSTSNANQITLATIQENRALSGELKFQGFVDDDGHLSVTGPLGVLTAGFLHGGNYSVSSDLSQFTFRGGSGNIAVQARVLGVTL